MLSDTNFGYSRQLIASMSLDQLNATHNDIGERFKGLLLPTKTFNIIEVLEPILEYLDFCDIMRAMRISRVFRDTIVGSAKLKRKLFILPSRGFDLGAILDIDAQLAEFVNPLVENVAECLGFAFDRSESIAAAEYHGGESSVPFIQLIVKSDFRGCPLPIRAVSGKDLAGRATLAGMRITTLPISVCLRFEKYDWKNRRSFISCYHLEPEEATLGALHILGLKPMEQEEVGWPQH